MKKEEVEACVKMYHKKMLRCRHSQVVKDVAAVVNSMHKSHLKSTFLNKAPLRPVTSSSVMNQVQIDLFDMKNNKVTIGLETYRYILVLLDVFSRFKFLRMLKTKSSTKVSDTGPPRRLQGDQGT